MKGEAAMGAVMRRMLAVLREDLQSLCECECVGGVSAAHCCGALRFEADALDEVRGLIRLIREGEALVGRAAGGPAWLDAVIDGRRDVLWEVLA